MYIRKEYLYRCFVDSLLAFVGVSVVYESSLLFLSQLILFLWWGKATTGGKEITVDFTNTPWGTVMRDESGIAHERVSETSSHRGDDNSEHSQVVSGPTDESSEHWDAAAHIAPPVRPNTSVVRFSWMSRLYLGPLMSAAVVEFIGTFFLVLTVPLSSLWNSELAPISVGFMLMSMVFSFGYLSGGHINPMVSFSVWLASLHPSATPINGGKKFEKRRLLLYVIAQMAGGSVASLYCLLIYGNGFPVPNMGLDFGVMLRGFLAELVFTFVLCSTVLHVAISKQRSNSFYGFAIGFAVLCGGLTCGSISGGVFNPAIATPLILCRCLFSFSNSGCTPMASLWVYWASELVGSVLATGFYLMTHNAVGES